MTRSEDASRRRVPTLRASQGAAAKCSMPGCDGPDHVVDRMERGHRDRTGRADRSDGGARQPERVVLYRGYLYVGSGTPELNVVRNVTGRKKP